VLRYEKDTETFLRFGAADGLKGGAYRELRRYGSELWFFGEQGIDIYSTRQQNWSFMGIEEGLRSTEWQAIAEAGGLLYFLHDSEVDICERESRRIYPFEREKRLAGYEVFDLYGSQTELWFATDRGLLQYQREDPQTGQPETWVLFDASRGGYADGYRRAGSAAGVIFGQGETALDVLNLSSELFLEPLIYEEATGAYAEPHKQPRIRWDEEGLRVLPGGETELGLTGSYNYLIRTDDEGNEDRYWGRLQPYLRHGSGRSINGLYDNTDPDKVLYGATYRGIEGDLLRRAEGGNRITTQQTFDPFFGSTTLRGGSAMLEAGPRSERKRRSLLRGDVTAGEVITHAEREYFNGSQGPIYILKHQDLLIGSARVYLNSRLLSDDEYSLNYTLGNFWFTFIGWELLNQGDVIEVEYQYRLQEEEIGEFYTSGEIVVSQGDALQVAVSGFEKGESRADSLSGGRPGAIRGAQAAAELRGDFLGGDGQLLAAFGAGESDEGGSEFARGYALEGSFNRQAWTFSGKWLNLSDSLATLDSRATEFGALKGEDAFSIRYEPSGRLRLSGGTSERRGEEGSERNYRFSGQYSPVSGTSTFGTLDYFDATADSLDRERWIGSLGIETAFLPGLLEALRIRSSRLHVITRLSQVRFDSLGGSPSEEISLRTKSVLTRWSIVPGAKLNFFPEVRWSASEKATGDAAYQPDREEMAPRATLYTRNLIPGLTTYIHGEAAYRQGDYDASAEERNLGFEREGIAQIDLTPGVYLSLLNPVSLRLNVARNAEDSLLSINEDIGFFDLGSSWSDYPSNVMSYRYDSDAMQVTWAPHSHWLYYQSISEVRSTVSPTEQYFTTRVEWKPRSSDQIFWKYSLKRIFTSEGDEIEHRPGVEWYRRWSSRTYTRGQVYVSSVDEPLLRSVSISPGGYLDQRFALPWRLGEGVYRMDLSATFSKQSEPVEESLLLLGGYSRLDWSLLRRLLLRFRYDGDYMFSYSSGESNYTWSLEVRLSARF
jgi:hypothetical protein